MLAGWAVVVVVVVDGCERRCGVEELSAGDGG